METAATAKKGSSHEYVEKDKRETFARAKCVYSNTKA
jgi:hypothetical protein